MQFRGIAVDERIIVHERVIVLSALPRAKHAEVSPVSEEIPGTVDRGEENPLPKSGA